MATRRLVFFGFGLTDPYILELLKTVAVDLWRGNKAIHFAVVPIEAPIDSEADARQHETRFRTEYGIQLIFYDKEDQKHNGLGRLVNQIAAACGVGTLKPATEKVFDEQPPPGATSVDPAMAKRVIEAANRESDRSVDRQ